MRSRRGLLVILAGVCLVAWLLLLLAWEHSYREPANYTRIEPGLYLGGRVAQPPPGTDAVLNLCESPDPYEPDVKLWESIADAAPAPDLEWLRRVVGFIEEQRRADRVVFVHCRNGVSRGGMVVVAYLMHRNGWTRDQTLAFVRARRPITRLNPAFMERLREWETSCTGADQ